MFMASGGSCNDDDVVTGSDRRLSSDPGISRSINLGDCPGRLRSGEKSGGDGSSNKLFKLLVTWSGSSLGRGNSLMNGGVLISNIGSWSKEISGGLFEKVGIGLSANGSCADPSSTSTSPSPSASASSVEAASDGDGLAAGTGSTGLLDTESKTS